MLRRKIKQDKGVKECRAGVVLWKTLQEGDLRKSEGRQGTGHMISATRKERGRQKEHIASVLQD